MVGAEGIDAHHGHQGRIHPARKPDHAIGETDLPREIPQCVRAFPVCLDCLHCASYQKADSHGLAARGRHRRQGAGAAR